MLVDNVPELFDLFIPTDDIFPTKFSSMSACPMAVMLQTIWKTIVI